jgi:tRNA (guanine37-N1)-methyltransferase
MAVRTARAGENMEEIYTAETLCLRLNKRHGESALRLLRELQLFDARFRIGHDGDQLLIALARPPSELELAALEDRFGGIKVEARILNRVCRKPRTVIEALRGQLAPHQLADLPKSVDIVGEVAIIELPKELQKYEALIGKAVLETNKNLRTVLAKDGPVSTQKRLRPLRVIAGSGITETTHIEYGCLFRVDVAKTYFSPRLSFEHNRVATQVKENETVVDMFAGVGPFTIQIAKRRRKVCVYAIDINDDAIRYLRENIRLNHVEGKVVAIKGDAREVIEDQLAGQSDRVIMNLPSQSAGYLDAACLALKPKGGIIHYYAFCGDPDPINSVEKTISEALLRAGRRIEKTLCSRIVKGTAPYEWLCALDALVA